jgi:nitrogen fixation protein NifU and related proteins
MSELRELYQEVILDHGRSPRNFARPADANRDCDGFNPLCGDKVHVYLTVTDGVVEDVGFEGAGCAISMASASMMTEILKGKTEAEVKTLFDRFHDLVMGEAEITDADLDDPDLERLVVLVGVREFPMRVKCATLAWHTMTAALDGNEEEVRTE